MASDSVALISEPCPSCGRMANLQPGIHCQCHCGCPYDGSRWLYEKEIDLGEIPDLTRPLKNPEGNVNGLVDDSVLAFLRGVSAYSKKDAALVVRQDGSGFVMIDGAPDDTIRFESLSILEELINGGNSAQDH